MHPNEEKAKSAWDRAGPKWQVKPGPHNKPIIPPTTSARKLLEQGPCGRDLWACTCAAGGGVLITHAGCIVSPMLAFAGAAGMTASSIGLLVSLGLTGAGVGAWYGLRGRNAGAVERGFTLAGALTGAAMVLGVHFFLADGAAHHGEFDRADAWYRALPGDEQNTIKHHASARGVSLSDYIRELCASPPPVSAAPGPGR